MAECHPVGFQWVVEARKRGARVIHVDPRFTRTSAIADTHVALRTGTDIAWLGGLINYVLQNGREFREYVVKYTTAATCLSDDYAWPEALDGVFAGCEDGSDGVSRWRYEGMEVPASAGKREQTGGERSHGAHGAALSGGDPPEIDETLEHPRCVFQVLKRHYARYTPEMVERVCGALP